MDYAGDKVTAQLFMDVLTGNAQRAKATMALKNVADVAF